MICHDFYDKIRGLDEGWEAHIFPGIQIHQAAEVIDKIENTEFLTTIIVAVGMGNRSCELDEIYADVESLTANMKPKEVTTIFVEVPIPSNITPKEQTCLKVINRAAKLRFGDKLCTVSYPTIEDTETEGTGDQNRADTFVRCISEFEYCLRLNEIMYDDDIEN